MRMRSKIPAPTMGDFIIVNDYTVFDIDVYDFMKGLREIFFENGTKKQNSNIIHLLMNVYFLGEIQGIRRERHDRRTKHGKQQEAQK